MKVCKQILSLVMSVIMLSTSSNVLYASDFIKDNSKEIIELRKELEGNLSLKQKFPTSYGDEIPTLKEIQKKSFCCCPKY